MQQHAASFIAHAEASTGWDLPKFVKDEFDAFLEGGTLAHCFFLKLRCGECGHDKLLAFSCKRRGLQPVTRRAADVADRAAPGTTSFPYVLVRQWVLSVPIPLRVLLAAQPELVTPVLQVVQRVVTRHLLYAAELAADAGHDGPVTLIQRFGSTANLNIHLHCLMLDGVYQCGADGTPALVEVAAPTDHELHALLQTVIAHRDRAGRDLRHPLGRRGRAGPARMRRPDVAAPRRGALQALIGRAATLSGQDAFA